MRRLGLTFALCAAVGLLACSGKQSASNPGTADSTTPAKALVPDAKAPDAAANTGTPQPATVPKTQAASKVVRTNEDGSETVEDTSGDSGTQNALLAAVASTVPAAAAATTTGSKWTEGKNYTRLVPNQPTDVPPGHVEVLEFFWYACPHCASLDPAVESWRKSKPAYVTFVRVPVMWNAGHRALARMFYTLQSIGKLDQLHSAIFNEIQANGDPLIGEDPTDTAQDERVQLAFLTKHGVAEKDFSAAYHSMAVDTALLRADQLMQRYRVDGVPTFVINGKYVADVRSADGPDNLLALVGDLAAQEHKP